MTETEVFKLLPFDVKDLLIRQKKIFFNRQINTWICTELKDIR